VTTTLRHPTAEGQLGLTEEEAARRRLARKLHDEKRQALTSILLGLKGLEDVGSESELAGSTGRLRGNWS
jgi:signal transduction histidine kinase